MDAFFKFAGEHPVLTFFLVVVIASALVEIVQSIFHR